MTPKIKAQDAYLKAFTEVLSRIQQALKGSPSDVFPIRMYVAGGAALRDDLDHARRGLGAVQRGGRGSLDDLDALDVGGVDVHHRVDLALIAAHGAGPGVVVRPDTVHVDQRVAAQIEAADAAVKSANVKLIEVRLAMALGGKAFFTCTGEVAAVTAAVDAGAKVVSERGLLVNKVVIAQPRQELLSEMI